MEPITADSTVFENSPQETEQEKGNLDGRDVEVEVKQHMDNAKENLIEYAKDCVKASAPVCAAITNATVLPAVISAIIVIDGIPKFIEGCAEYNEAKRLENEAKGLDKFGNPLILDQDYNNSSNESGCERENDRDSWDREY